MRAHPGVAAAMFESLKDANVNIQMITTSEIKGRHVIERDQVETAVRALHNSFELAEMQPLRAPDFSVTVAMGLAWLAVALSTPLVLQAIFQSQFFEIDFCLRYRASFRLKWLRKVFTSGLLTCFHSHSQCTNLKPGDRVILSIPRVAGSNEPGCKRPCASLLPPAGCEPCKRSGSDSHQGHWTRIE